MSLLWPPKVHYYKMLVEQEPPVFFESCELASKISSKERETNHRVVNNGITQVFYN